MEENGLTTTFKLRQSVFNLFQCMFRRLPFFFQPMSNAIIYILAKCLFRSLPYVPFSPQSNLLLCNGVRIIGAFFMLSFNLRSITGTNTTVPLLTFSIGYMPCVII